MQYRERMLEPVGLMNEDDYEAVFPSVEQKAPSSFSLATQIDGLDNRLIQLIKALDR